MSMSANLHGLESVEAEFLENCTNDVLKLRAADGSHVAVFMPYDIAAALAETFRTAKRLGMGKSRPEEQHGDAACGGDLA